MIVELSTLDMILIQHALGYYAAVEGFNHNKDLARDMREVKDRLRLQELQAKHATSRTDAIAQRA
jgi:hypothetical protein